jgi:hypothetical protein
MMDIRMPRWWLTLMLMVVMATAASAQPGPPAASTAATDHAGAIMSDADRRVVQLGAQRAPLKKRYRDELDAIDRLKNQRASWRRDRELRDSLSSSLETANQLSAVDREIERASIQLLSVQRAYLAAIAAELSAGATPLRAHQLQQARTPLERQLKAAPHRIVIPDLEIDPLADPEELDQRAVELRATEAELNRQLGRFDQEAAELEHLASLRKQHNRAGDLFSRDNDEPQRGATRKSSDVGAVTEDPGGDAHLPATGGAGPLGTPTSGFESYVPTILADVVDASTIASFAAAQRSTDPAQRAAAAHKAHDAVASRLEQVKRKRAEIEARARQLRGKR